MQHNKLTQKLAKILYSILYSNKKKLMIVKQIFVVPLLVIEVVSALQKIIVRQIMKG